MWVLDAGRHAAVRPNPSPHDDDDNERDHGHGAADADADARALRPQLGGAFLGRVALVLGPALAFDLL